MANGDPVAEAQAVLDADVAAMVEILRAMHSSAFPSGKIADTLERLAAQVAQHEAARVEIDALREPFDNADMFAHGYDMGVRHSLAILARPAARVEAVDEERWAIAKEARRYAAFYPQGSDGRNTFVMLAEWIEGRANKHLPPAAPAEGER